MLVWWVVVGCVVFWGRVVNIKERREREGGAKRERRWGKESESGRSVRETPHTYTPKHKNTPRDEREK